MNWAVLIPFAILILALLAFMIIRNMRDEKKFIEQVKRDYKKSRDEEGDIDSEPPVR